MITDMYRALSRSLRKLRRLLNSHEVEIETELSYFPKLIYPCRNTLHVFEHLHDNCILKPYFAACLPISYETPRSTELTIKSVQDGLSFCFQLMRQINYRINLLEDEDYTKKPEHIRYRVGQIFRHAKFQNWGVIVGYDEICQQSATWQKNNDISKLKRGANQPYYRTVFIEKDDEEEIQDQVRTGYTAQESLIIDKHFTLEDISHPTLQQMFPAVIPEIGYFEVGEELARLYPDDAYWVFVQSQYVQESSRIIFQENEKKLVFS